MNSKYNTDHSKWTVKKLIAFEDRVIRAFEKGKCNCPIHLCGGNEQQLIDIFKDIHKEDWVISTHRNHYHYLLKGGDSGKLFDELCGKTSGVCSGYGRSMHIFDREHNFLTSGIVGGGVAIACGVAMGIKLRKGVEKVYCFIGDGAMDSGHSWEAIRYAIAQDLPVVFVIEDNNLSIDTTVQERWGDKDLPPTVVTDKVIHYRYTRKHGHVGIGKFVGF